MTDNRVDALDYDDGRSWGFISTDLCSFLGVFDVVYDLFRREKPDGVCRFVDIGCGAGNVLVALAVRYHEDVVEGRLVLSGVEKIEDLARLAPRMSGPADVKQAPEVICADCLDVDYGRFDIVHHYGPFKDAQAQSQLDRKVMDDIGVGAFIISRLRADKTILNHEGFTTVFLGPTEYQVFRKK